MDLPEIPVSVVVIGGLNSGKSTLTGHLIYTLGGEGEYTIERLDNLKYAWIVDRLTAERERGITIEAKIFDTVMENYLVTLIDAPGHTDYLINMVNATPQADCSLLVVDSTSFEDGVFKGGENQEPALIASVLGVRHMICCINKMDAIVPPYSEYIFDEIVEDISARLEEVGYNPDNIDFVPISGLEGDNLIEPSDNLGWYDGPTLVDAIQQIVPERELDKPLRIPVHDVRYIEKRGTIATGRVETGLVDLGSIVTFGPSMVTARVGSLQKHQRPIYEAYRAYAGSFVDVKVDNVSAQDIRRGDVLTYSLDAPMPAASFTSQIHVVNYPGQISSGFTSVMCCHTSHVDVKISKIVSKLDASGLEVESFPECLVDGEMGIVKMIPAKPLVVELYSDMPSLGRFLLTDLKQTVAFGVIKDIERVKNAAELLMLVISNLAEDITEADIRFFFACSGIRHVSVKLISLRGKFLGSAEVQFRNLNQKYKALELNGTTLQGREVVFEALVNKKRHPLYVVVTGFLVSNRKQDVFRPFFKDEIEQPVRFIFPGEHGEKNCNQTCLFLYYRSREGVRDALALDGTRIIGARLKVIQGRAGGRRGDLNWMV